MIIRKITTLVDEKVKKKNLWYSLKSHSNMCGRCQKLLSRNHICWYPCDEYRDSCRSDRRMKLKIWNCEVTHWFIDLWKICIAEIFCRKEKNKWLISIATFNFQNVTLIFITCQNPDFNDIMKGDIRKYCSFVEKASVALSEAMQRYYGTSVKTCPCIDEGRWSNRV